MDYNIFLKDVERFQKNMQEGRLSFEMLCDTVFGCFWFFFPFGFQGVCAVVCLLRPGSWPRRGVDS